MHAALRGSIICCPVLGNMLMKCAFATLEMHGIENRWDPLGQLFSDDNSERDSLMRIDWKLYGVQKRQWLQQLRNDEQRRSKQRCSFGFGCSWITLDVRWTMKDGRLFLDTTVQRPNCQHCEQNGRKLNRARCARSSLIPLL